MKRFIVCTLLVVAFGVYGHAQQQFQSSKWAWGIAGGGAIGSNSPSDNWVMLYRGYIQYDINPSFLTQLGVEYTDLNAAAPTGYDAETGIADIRLLFRPFSLPDLNPFVYVGFGASKSFTGSGSSFLPIIPLGAGLQTKLTSGMLLMIDGGYYLSLSTKLHGPNTAGIYTTNNLSGKANDGFYSFTLGLALTIGGKDEPQIDTKKQALADAEAVRVKQQADAEARRVREGADAEARRVKQQADAAAAAKLEREATDAEARRVKEASDAEARRLAEQKGADTVFVFTKGKTVVLRGVNFEFNKATLTKESERILWRAHRAMIANPDVQVVITGHTDNIGGQQFNQKLSLERAQTVRNWLYEKGIKSDRMRTVGKGLNEPVATNDTEEGRAENRRIEFYVQQ
jgi:outer membrane protein OmpA-like peptidoglycan-associated protein